jgi:trehalose 2-sulfotransferase
MPAATSGVIQVDPFRGRPRRTAEKKSAGPISFAGQAFDLPGPQKLRKSYIIASTPRCGSTFLCTRLWATGVLGAPAEYFAYQKPIGTKMMERLKAPSPAGYLDKLLACRTSNNGVFGVNLDFNDFNEALRRFPGMLDVLSPVTYIFVDRRDQLVQAAFMAKDVQANAEARLAKTGRQRTIARYDRDLISKWLGRIERQRLGWMRWFAANKITPFIISYEQLTADPASAVRRIAELLGVENDEPQKLRVVLAQKPSDRASEAWAACFEREIAKGIEYREPRTVEAAAEGPHHVTAAGTLPHIFDRYDQINGKTAEPTAAKRLRHRYEAIVARNRDLFKNARVLDIRSGGGYWSLAALDAGASYVVGVESQQRTVEAAAGAFARIGVDSASYRFVNAKIFATLNSFSPEAFDLVLCREISSDPHFFFKCLQRLQPKHVILDTKIINRKEPTAVFALRQGGLAGKATARSASISAVPNHALISTLGDYFGFRCRVIDWRSLGISDWTGVGDYKRDRRRTYVLARVGPPEPARDLEQAISHR